MWKHFIPPSFRITKAQQARIEDFIDIGDAFIQNIAKFSRLEKDFKHNLELFLSEQRKREQYKREQAKLGKLREYEKKLRKRKEMKKKRQKRIILEKIKKRMREKTLKQERN